MEQLAAMILAGCTIAAALGQQPDGRAEAKLLATMQETAQCVVENHVYTDMDHDGIEEIVCLVPFQYGYVRMTDAGDILLNVEDYDSMFDPLEPEDDSDGIMLGHTWKDTYLFYEDGVYKEYGAIEITEETFLAYQNAQMLKDQIEKELREENTVSMEYSYFRRSNGIMHIQCDVKNEFGGISYGYYTVRYEGNVLEKKQGAYNPGRMYSYFSNFEKMY